MKLMIVKCPGCGATVEFDPHDYTIRCQYCNLPILVEEKLEDVTKMNKYLKLGERYYHDKEYQEAYQAYQKVIEVEPDNELAVLRKGLSKALCTSYREFQIEYAINGMKNCYVLLKKKRGNSEQINQYILECSNTIAELENSARRFYQSNALKLDFNEIHDYILKLQLCLNGFEYLYSIIENNTQIESIILNGMISTIDNILQNKRYKIEQNNTKNYRLRKDLKTQLLQKRQLCVKRQLEINPNAVIGKVENKIGKIIGNILCYCMVAFCTIMVIGTIYYPLIITPIMWLITAIIFLPKVKEKIVTKFKKSKSFILACRVILPIVACMALVLETPYLFENVWISSNGMKVTLKDNKAIIRLEDGTELNGIYTQNYDNNNYTIRVKAQMAHEIKEYTFHCMEENSVITFFLEEDNKNIYFIPENPNTAYENEKIGITIATY